MITVFAHGGWGRAQLCAVPGPEQGPAIPLPQWLDRNQWQFQGFMNQCHLLFQVHPQICASDQANIALVISLLTGDALDWASPLLEDHSPVLLDWDAFLQLMSTIFDDLH
uniref:DUF4939 domain-containing protein n=1 Tax=Terrapene triunguis TaxID=2587831 RepID=A0A674I9Z9_9SAUR